MPPLFRESRSRRSWRREVAQGLVDRLDAEGELRFVGTHPSDRAEMLRVAELMPEDVIAELYEDPDYPGCTFMELRLVPAGSLYDRGDFKVVYPESDPRRRAAGEY
jgi:hypothetical protein